MKLTLEPQPDYVTITIKDDEDAREFCRLAGEVVSEGCDEKVKKDLEKTYAQYGEQQAKDDTTHWHRCLWDYVVERREIPGGCVAVTFAAKLLAKLNLL